MTRSIALSVLAVAVLGACSSAPQSGSATPPTPKVATKIHPFTPGQGTVTAVMPAPSIAAAGGTAAGGAAEPVQRLEVKMDNGAVQYVDVPSKEFTKGTRINLSQDKIITKM